MRYPRPYQYEIVIPIKLRIPIYVEPVVIDASDFSKSDTDTLNPDPSAQISEHISQTPVADSALIPSNLNVEIQPELVEQKFTVACQSQSAYLTRSTAWANIDLDLKQALRLPKHSRLSTYSRSMLLLATAFISAAMVQVLSWTFDQLYPPVSHDSLLWAGLKIGHPALFRSVPTDGSVRDIEPLS